MRPEVTEKFSPAILAGGIAFVVAAALALLARGLAGDEEIGHFLVARRALDDPTLFLSLSGRPLVTLVLALPSLLGLTAARFASVLAVAVTAWALVRTARSFSGIPPLWAVLFLLVQPVYLAHAGTAMTEPWAALLVALLLFAFVEKKAGLLVTAAALLPLARLELLILWPFVVGALVSWKKFLHLAWLVVPISLWNYLGALTSGDPLWLLHQSEWGAYEERTWWHYLGSYVWVVGAGLFAPVLMGLLSAAWPERDTQRRIVLPAALFFLIGLTVYTFFAWWRPVTFGNLRYLAVMAPAVALLALEGVRLAARADRRAWIGGGAAALGALLFWNHPWFHDHTMLERTDFFPLIAALAWIPALFASRRFPAIAPILVMVLALTGIARNHAATLHLVPGPEHAAAGELASRLAREAASGAPIITRHPVVDEALGARRSARGTLPADPIRGAGAIPPGTRYVWDSHYARGTSPDSLLGHAAWSFRGGVVASDSAWVGGIFERRAAADGGGASVRPPGDAENPSAWLFAARMAMVGLPRVREMALADPGSVEAQRVLAGRLLAAGRPAEGYAAFSRADAMEPGNPENEAFRAELLLRSGRMPEAGAAIRRALSSRPSDGNILALAAQIATALGRPNEARVHLIEAARRLPNRWEIQFAVGTMYLSANELEPAERHMAKALRLNPGHTSSGLALAEIAYRNRRVDQVEERLNAVLSRKPDCLEAWRSLGEILLEAGRKEEALSVWRRGLVETHGDTTLARRIAEVDPDPGVPQPAEP